VHPTFSQATEFCWYIGSEQGNGVPVHVPPVHVQPGDPWLQFKSANWLPIELAASHDAVPAQWYVIRHPTPGSSHGLPSYDRSLHGVGSSLHDGGGGPFWLSPHAKSKTPHRRAPSVIEGRRIAFSLCRVGCRRDDIARKSLITPLQPELSPN
jgi:hypothetical protein